MGFGDCPHFFDEIYRMNLQGQGVWCRFLELGFGHRVQGFKTRVHELMLGIWKTDSEGFGD